MNQKSSKNKNSQRSKFHLNYLQIHSKDSYVFPLSMKHLSNQFSNNNTSSNASSNTSSTNNSTINVTSLSKDEQEKLWVQKSWELAKSPFKQLLMTAFMLYMSGSAIQIFSIMMLIMSFIQPIRAIFNVKETFQFLEDKKIDVSLQKIVYILFQFLGIVLVLFKCYYMNLLPSNIDWMNTAYIPSREISKGFII